MDSEKMEYDERDFIINNYNKSLKDKIIYLFKSSDNESVINKGINLINFLPDEFETDIPDYDEIITLDNFSMIFSYKRSRLELEDINTFKDEDMITEMDDYEYNNILKKLWNKIKIDMYIEEKIKSRK